LREKSPVAFRTLSPPAAWRPVESPPSRTPSRRFHAKSRPPVEHSTGSRTRTRSYIEALRDILFPLRRARRPLSKWYGRSIAQFELESESFFFRRQGQAAHIFQIPVAFGVVQPVSHHKVIWNRKTNIVALHIFDAPRGLVEQRRDLQGFWLTLLQDAQKVGECNPGIENVLDHDDVQTLNAAVQIFQQPDLAGTLLPFAVTRNRDEVDRRIQINFTDQVRQENTRALQHAHQMNALALEIPGDGPRHFHHPLLNSRAANQHLQFFLTHRGWHFDWRSVSA